MHILFVALERPRESRLEHNCFKCVAFERDAKCQGTISVAFVKKFWKRCISWRACSSHYQIFFGFSICQTHAKHGKMRALAAKWQNEDKKEGNTRNCQWPCTTYLIFVDNTTNISVEKFVMEKFIISPHHRCGQIWNFSISCMCVMWRMSPHKCKIYAVLLYNRFCHDLHCFVAKYFLLQFAHFCVEKI